MLVYYSQSYGTILPGFLIPEAIYEVVGIDENGCDIEVEVPRSEYTREV